MDCRTALSPSRLPGLDWALNPYRGCEHRCAYCYAQDVTRFATDRPWGDTVEVRANIVTRLKTELVRGVSGVCGIGTVTDPYQPVEEEYELTRGCVAVLRRFDARISILTKSDLVLRDLDLLKSWPSAEVGVTVSCIDERISSVLEPGAPSPRRRFEAMGRLSSEGVDCYLMAAPVIPGVSDSEELLAGMVSEAKGAGIGRIMWDMYNPKPIAHSRLMGALERSGIRPGPSASPGRASDVRRVLARECTASGIQLTDAF